MTRGLPPSDPRSLCLSSVLNWIRWTPLPPNKIPGYATVPKWFLLVPNAEGIFGGRRFISDEEVKDAVKDWLKGLAADVYDEGIKKTLHALW